MNDIDQGALTEAVDAVVNAGGSAVAHRADVSDWDSAGELVERCVDEFGAIDGLVNNAGIVRLAKPHDETAENLRRVLEVNLLGTAYCAVHAVRLMLAAGSGSIVNTVSGSQAGWNLMGAYGASKGGVASLTYCWALDLEGTGVRINAVSPVGETRLRDHFAEYLGAAYTPGPGVDPRRNAPVVEYLLSDRSVALNGQVVRIDGHQLGFVTHPSVAAPVLTDDWWDFDGIAAAFDGELGEHIQPLGMVAAATRFDGR